MAPPIFHRAAITLGIGPHSSWLILSQGEVDSKGLARLNTGIILLSSIDESSISSVMRAVFITSADDSPEHIAVSSNQTCQVSRSFTTTIALRLQMLGSLLIDNLADDLLLANILEVAVCIFFFLCFMRLLFVYDCSGFLPVAVNFLRRVPVIGMLLYLPGISHVCSHVLVKCWYYLSLSVLMIIIVIIQLGLVGLDFSTSGRFSISSTRFWYCTSSQCMSILVCKTLWQSLCTSMETLSHFRIFWEGAGSPSNTKSPGLRSTPIPSGIVMHPAVWAQ